MMGLVGYMLSCLALTIILYFFILLFVLLGLLEIPAAAFGWGGIITTYVFFMIILSQFSIFGK